MTPSKIEEFVIRHDAGLAVVDVSIGNLTNQHEKLTKAISDLSTRLAGWVEEAKEGSMKIEIRLALIEKEIAGHKLANDRGRTVRVALLTALFSASLSLVVSIIIAVYFKAKG